MTKPFKQEDLSEALWGEQDQLHEIVMPIIDHAIEEAQITTTNNGGEPPNTHQLEAEVRCLKRTVNTLVDNQTNILKLLVAKGVIKGNTRDGFEVTLCEKDIQ